MPAFDDHILEIRLRGFTLLPDLLTPEECGEARRELDRILEEERSLPGKQYGAHGGWAYNLMNKARIFERTPVTEIRHDSAPGQLATSAIVAASARPRLAAESRRNRSRTSPTATHRNTRS